MTKEEALRWCEQKITGVKELANPKLISTQLDDRSTPRPITDKQLKAELARLEAARADILTWPDDINWAEPGVGQAKHS